MRELKPDAEVAILEDTGHMPMLERPALTAERYVSFVSKHD